MRKVDQRDAENVCHCCSVLRIFTLNFVLVFFFYLVIDLEWP